MANIAWSESFFLKNVLISDRNFVTLCIGIGVLVFLFCTLKLLFSCDIRKNPMLFLHLYIHGFINIRSSNIILIYDDIE